jgi:hypothetical protein
MVILCIICSKCMWLDILVFVLQSMNLLDTLLVWNVYSVNNLLLGLCITKLFTLASCHFLYEAVLVECLKIDDLFIQLGVFPLTTWQKLKSDISMIQVLHWHCNTLHDILDFCMHDLGACLLLYSFFGQSLLVCSVGGRLLWVFHSSRRSYSRASKISLFNFD